MKKEKYLLFILTFLAFVLAFTNTTYALNWDWGDNITIYDGREDTNHESDWYAGSNQGTEDQEVEPGNEIGQKWDLEGFFLNNEMLTMVGGYDFVNGEDMWIDAGNDGESGTDDDNYQTIVSGDIFIDIDGSYGTGPGNYGYEYVLDMEFGGTTTYTVYDLRNGTIELLDVISGLGNGSSNPWRYESGGSSITTGNALYQADINDTDSGFLGDSDGNASHNAVRVDLSFLNTYELANFTAHFTMECGNDNLMGSPVPEPATMILFGLGLLGITAIGRKRGYKA